MVSNLYAFTCTGEILALVLLLCLHRPAHLSGDNEQLMKKYLTPWGSDFRISQVLLEPAATTNNYRARMHELLYIEEIAQYHSISRSVVSLCLMNESLYQHLQLCKHLVLH